MVITQPLEMNIDHQEILDAAWTEGYVSEQMFTSQYMWTKHRFYGVMNVLVREGIAWVDMYISDKGSYVTCITNLSCFVLRMDVLCIYQDAGGIIFLVYGVIEGNMNLNFTRLRQKCQMLSMFMINLMFHSR